MSEVTRILSRIESGDRQAGEQLLPLVYDELRKLAAAKLAQERPGHTLQATALVNEAYLRLVGQEPSFRSQGPASWESRGHFFAAAAEAMRRILIENARRKKSLKRGGDGARMELDEALMARYDEQFDLLELNDALEELDRHSPAAGQLVKLRYFVGFGHQEAADALGITRREADRLWALARAWLFQQLGDSNA